MREKSRTFLHSGIHHQPIVQFIQVCSELFMLCHTFVYVVLYFAKRPLVISNSKKSPTVLPRWALTHTYIHTTMSAWRSYSYLSVFTALEHSAFALWQVCHKLLTFPVTNFTGKLLKLCPSLIPYTSPKKLKCPFNPLQHIE